MRLEYTRLDKATERLEKAHIRELEKQYQEALKEINAKMAKEYAKHAQDGKLTMAEMSKYNRLETLQKNIQEDLNSLTRGSTNQLKGYLTDVYMVNFKGVAEDVGEVTRVATGFADLDRQSVYTSILRPLTLAAVEENNTMFKLGIKRAITQGIVQGESIRNMSKRIQERLEVSANRAVMIARTETTGVMGDSRLQAMQELDKRGVKIKKVWLATSDSRTRDSHSRLNGEIQDLDKPFSNGLMFPGDQTGAAAEVVNCRCTMNSEIDETSIR